MASCAASRIDSSSGTVSSRLVVTADLATVGVLRGGSSVTSQSLVGSLTV